MAYRKASEENPVVALGSEDFWAAVQNGGDVRISVGDILVWLRTVLQIEDVNELQAALDAVGATAHDELQAALGSLGGSVSESLADLQADVNTRATKDELTTALGGLDGSVKTKLDTLTADVAARDTKIRSDIKAVTDTLATKAQLGTAAARNAGNAAGQLPVLGADGKLDASTIPAVAITDTFPVANQAAMLASGAERGDIAIRTDLNKCFILQVEPATTLANWKELLTPTDAVLSVAGLTGAITAAGLKAALGIAIGDVAGLQAALNSIRTDFAAADTAVRGEFAAADTSIRTDFAAADTKIRQDFAAADALKLDKAGGTVTGLTQFLGGPASGAMAAQADAAASILRVTSAGAGASAGLAGMSFLRNGLYGTWFGLDTDNEFKFGGWSEGAVAHRFWTSKNFNPDTKASLNASVSFSALTVSARPTWAGLTPWDNGNFNPATKADLAGATFTGNVSIPNLTLAGSVTTGGSHFFGSRVGQHVNLFGTSYGIGIQNSTLYARTGGEFAVHSGGVHSDTQADPGTGGTALMRVHANYFLYKGNTVWGAWNFNPDTKANLAGAAFTGDVTTTGRLVAGVGQNASYVEMRDGDEGTRYLHNNSSSIGFLNKSAGWSLRSFDDGNLWSPAFGYITDYVGARVAKTGDTMTGDLWINKANPEIRFHYSGVISGRMYVGSDGILRWTNADSGADLFRVGTNGSLYCAQLGDINTRIEDRAYAWANDRLAVARNEYANHAKTNVNNYFTGQIGTNQQIYIDNNNLRFYNSAWGGSRHVNLATDGNLYLTDNAGNNTHFFTADGNLWTRGHGWLTDYVNGRASAYANERVAKTGDTMTGDLLIQKAYPSFRMLYPGVRDMLWQVREDANAYLWDNSAGTWQMRVDTGGSVVARGSLYTGNGSANMATNGDIWGAVWGSKWLSTRIGEIDNNANGRVWRGGDTMSGNLIIGKEHPELQLLWGGVIRWGILVRNNAELQFRNADNDAVHFAFRNNGTIWTQAYGELDGWVRNIVNNKSARLAYAGDLDNNWNLNAGGSGDPYSEPYGGGVMTTRYTTSYAAVTYWSGARWRYLQMSDAWGNWYTCGYV